MNPLSHNLQVIDYNLFMRNAGLTQDDFSNPCGWATEAPPNLATAHGHFTQMGWGKINHGQSNALTARLCSGGRAKPASDMRSTDRPFRPTRNSCITAKKQQMRH
jgi:hypothetical protein